jgi:hypothetical protein
VDGTGLAVVLNLNAKHPMQLFEVRNLDVLTQASLELLNEADTGGSNGAVVDMHSGDGEITLARVDLEDGFVDQALFKAQRREYTGELLVPSPSRLLQAIEHFDKAEDSRAGVRGLVAWRVLHV